VTPPNPIDINYVTRACFLWRNGETYRYDGSLSPPSCWTTNAISGEGMLLANQARFVNLLSIVSDKGVSEASAAVRGLPSTYFPPVPINVSINTTPESSVFSYAVEDVPPSGWTVSNIDNGGTWDAANKKVKWGPFFDNTVRTLSYMATPPNVATGMQVFAGIASFDGVGSAISGATTVNPTPYASWKGDNFTAEELNDPTISGDMATPAGDGIPNLMKYGLLLNPKTNGVAFLPVAAILDAYLTLTYRENKSATDMIFAVQACGLLTTNTWSTDGLLEISRVDCNTWWSVTVQDGVPMNSATNRFMRLKVVRP
jgi:hypothetical protein